jgi:hypothetical protein
MIIPGAELTANIFLKTKLCGAKKKRRDSLLAMHDGTGIHSTPAMMTQRFTPAPHHARMMHSQISLQRVEVRVQKITKAFN